MIEYSNFKHLNYIRKEPLTGSMNGMRYILQKKKEGDETVLSVATWPEPFCFLKTEEKKKHFHSFSLDEEGLKDAVDWLNEEYKMFYGGN